MNIVIDYQGIALIWSHRKRIIKTAFIACNPLGNWPDALNELSTKLGEKPWRKQPYVFVSFAHLTLGDEKLYQFDMPLISAKELRYNLALGEAAFWRMHCSNIANDAGYFVFDNSERDALAKQMRITLIALSKGRVDELIAILQKQQMTLCAMVPSHVKQTSDNALIIEPYQILCRYQALGKTSLSKLPFGKDECQNFYQTLCIAKKPEETMITRLLTYSKTLLGENATFALQMDDVSEHALQTLQEAAAKHGLNLQSKSAQPSSMLSTLDNLPLGVLAKFERLLSSKQRFFQRFPIWSLNVDFKNQKTQFVIAWASVATHVVLLGLTWYLFSFVSLLWTPSEDDAWQTSNNILKQQQSLYRDLKARTKEQQALLKKLRKASVQDAHYQTLLAALPDILPSSIALVAIDYQSQTNQLALSFISADNESINVLLDQLKNRPFIKEMNLGMLTHHQKHKMNQATLHVLFESQNDTWKIDEH